MSSGVQQKNKVYYDLLNQRIKRKQDNLLKLQHAVKEMQNSLEHNETDASHDANILALNAMMEIEENRTIGY
ncbi:MULTISPECIES: hypothetical protein [Flammeovirga]|uniref:Uncharacterized protein n=2 Tax=Flammeovirga TaxID=59739 RepID=A0A3Q9FP54_9BACT|nr:MULTISPECIES: hypothetical protein [Flammeovirga]AZQ61647.1 hypothetical protein EI427_05195 [Flammeovirga pectinis]MBB6462862.1 hypothetical protein [Flammeovirga kamogawensis]QWG08356.1 hypothetical protein KM029_05320 [Flammeovirga kamogawensis]